VSNRSWVDVSSELSELGSAFDAFLRSTGPSYTQRSESLARRIGLRPQLGPLWTRQLSPLTVLYPLLQAEGLTNVPRAIARHAALAHLCLMIHAFTEDRIADGQLQPASADFPFSKLLLVEGLSVLRRLAPEATAFDRAVRRRLRTHASSHDLASEPDPANGTQLADSYVRTISTGRAALGVLASIALAQRATNARATITRVANAFSALSTALQWADDAEDWHADLLAGDANLLLDTLHLRRPDLSIGKKSDAVIVGRALVDTGTLGHANQQAARWVLRAVRAQSALGCHQLAQQINENFRPLENAIQRQTQRIESLATKLTVPRVPEAANP